MSTPPVTIPQNPKNQSPRLRIDTPYAATVSWQYKQVRNEEQERLYGGMASCSMSKAENNPMGMKGGREYDPMYQQQKHIIPNHCRGDINYLIRCNSVLSRNMLDCEVISTNRRNLKR